MTTDPTPPARELLEAALDSGVLMHATSPKDVIQTNTPGLSVDGALMRQRLVEGIASTPSGAELLRRADEPRVAEGLTRLTDAVPRWVWRAVYHSAREHGDNDETAMAHADVARITVERSMVDLANLSVKETSDVG